MIPAKAFVVADIPEPHRSSIQAIRNELQTLTAKLPVEITLAGSSSMRWMAGRWRRASCIGPTLENERATAPPMQRVEREFGPAVTAPATRTGVENRRVANTFPAAAGRTARLDDDELDPFFN